jgi:hypothetical protein
MAHKKKHRKYYQTAMDRLYESRGMKHYEHMAHERHERSNGIMHDDPHATANLPTGIVMERYSPLEYFMPASLDDSIHSVDSQIDGSITKAKMDLKPRKA